MFQAAGITLHAPTCLPHDMKHTDAWGGKGVLTQCQRR